MQSGQAGQGMTTSSTWATQVVRLLSQHLRCISSGIFIIFNTRLIQAKEKETMDQRGLL